MPPVKNLCLSAGKLSDIAVWPLGRFTGRNWRRQGKCWFQLELIKEAGQAIDDCGELSNTTFFLDAQKEYAEANTVLALVNGKDMPSPEELEVDNAAYLNGIGEAAGELRRYILDGLRKGEDTRGEELLQAMDDIYEVLVTMDFPDAITGGLRRTTDMVRGVLERTRSDLTLYIQQKGLEQKLEVFQSKLTERGII
ncbi:haloacid dehalogenase [Dehalococcoides mccartyi]|uniref:Haloacid dehalogenase n=1 Tax=Dehalococcoides mccartyi TaxID=61435 RepID=A0A2J1DXN7_9CHLR|nr:haloacid dehalogenase [Dehalococcoides mccartyi]